MANEMKEEKQPLYKEEPKPMTWDELERLSGQEIDDAVRYTRDILAPERMEKWDRYYGRNLGNEVAGRSQYMSRDLLETIEWVLPTLIRTLASGDPKVKLTIQGQEPWVGSALMRKIYEDLSADSQGSLFTVFYQWFKDALVSGAAYAKPFWEIERTETEETLSAISQEQMDQLAQEPNAEVKSASLIPGGGYSNVKVTISQLRRNQLVCENIPNWEFIAAKRTQSINDEYGKGQVTYVSMDYLKRINRARTTEEDGDFFVGLDELATTGQGAADNNSYDNLLAERDSYMDYEVLNVYDDTAVLKGGKAIIQLTEWYTRMDVDGDGFLEDVIVWRANNKMIRFEINEEGFIPISAISPIIDCYKLTGLSYADLIIELQNLKTVLFRRILDNYDYQNAGRWIVRPGAQVDTKALLDNIPGDVIRANPQDIQNDAPQPFHPQNLSILEYIDGVKENRTGSTRYNQGTDASSLNQTATGIQMIQSASMQRIEQVARIFAEGLKDFYQKSAMLYQKYLTEPFEANVKGRKVQVAPEMLQGEILARVDMGVEAQVGQAESAKLERLAGTLMQFDKAAPGVFGPEQIHNLAVKYTAAMGYMNTEDFVTPIDQFAQKQQQMQQQQAALMQMQQQMAAQQQQMEQFKIQLGMKELELKQQVETGKRQTELAKVEMDKETTLISTEQRDRDSIRDHQIAVAKLEQERNEPRREG